MKSSSIIKQFSDLRVTVIGDLMLDRYVFGDVSRISPEAPVQVLRVSEERTAPGGAANVANNLRSLGASVELYGVTGADLEGEELLRTLEAINVNSKGVIRHSTRPTTTKTRLISGNQQIVRIDREEGKNISDEVRAGVVKAITQSVLEKPPHGIIISDYAKGVVTRELLSGLIQMAKKRGVFVCVDPKGKDFRKYYGADVITPNQKETEEACGFEIQNDQSLRRAAEILIKETSAQGIVITRGGNGVSYYVAKSRELRTIPSQAREIFDVTGAGDTVVSTFTLCYILSKSWEESVYIANKAAGMVVGRVGAATVTQDELMDYDYETNQKSQQKLLERDKLSQVISNHRAKGEKIIFTNGCFDLFHAGHLELLKQAKALGDVLVVAVNSEDSTRRIKGDGRPFIPEDDRAKIIAALSCVDYVILFPEDTPLDLIKELKPHVLVKGGDYSPDNVVGRGVVESYGGQIAIIPLVDGVSTSLLVDRIRKQP